MIETPLDPGAIDRASVPFVRDLATFGDRVALIVGAEAITYRELAQRADDMAARLGTTRRLVAIAVANTVDAIVTYLGALRGGHVVLLLPAGHDNSVADHYEPDVMAAPDPSGAWRLDVRRFGSSHRLHPELALLLSTSGSTGSPKVVRLSHDNLQSNAVAIAEYLAIGPDDRAATTLPMHYCYGLSVIHSHLLAGAGVILTDLSVSEDDFWRLFRSASGTSFAGVPYTFELLDQIGFAGFDLPALRYVTQAGGRLDRQRVVRYAKLARQRGWKFFVMYGQTEATARMAYLPSDLAATRPATIGVPIPGGSFHIDVTIDDSPAPNVGELVYQGSNVMLGYAESPGDLGRGRDIDELRTGDLARQASDGLYEIVGRRSRFLKLFGLRFDLERVEERIRRLGLDVTCAGDDNRLVVAIAPRAGGTTETAESVAALLATEYSLPQHALAVCMVDELPRLATGKPDFDAVRRMPSPPVSLAKAVEPADLVATLCALYTEILHRPAVPAATFSGLGGDSLSFVQMSVRLQRMLGNLPHDWQHMPIRDLAAAAKPATGGWATIDLSVVLRAIAIILVVTQHTKVLPLHGGAHIMLAVAGFNLARFQFDDSGPSQRIRRVLSSLTRIVLPMIAFVTAVILLLGDYSPINLYLGYYITGAIDDNHESQLWFIEVIVFYVLGATLLVGNPWGYRLERRYPFALPMTLALLGLIPRYDLIPGLTASPYVSHGVTPLVIIWVFALGWAAARADHVWQKVLVTVTIVVAVPGFFGYELEREVVIIGLVALVWVRTLPSFSGLNRVLAVLAASSLYIYITHYQVFPLFAWAGKPNLLGAAASLVVGIAFAELVNRLPRLKQLSRRRTPTPENVV